MAINIKTLASITLTSVIGALSLSSQASALTAKTFMESVPFTQQELNTKEGVANVHKRLIVAAEKICVGNDQYRASLLLKADVEACIIKITDTALAPNRFAILASYNDSLSNPAKPLSARKLAKNTWTIERFKMAQMEAPKIDALP